LNKIGQLGQEIFTVESIPKKVKGDINGLKIKQIATKGDFVLAIDESGELFGWGNNEVIQQIQKRYIFQIAKNYYIIYLV
jgi:alpha-tubulin suppressor-like RCC1 family protein